MFDFVSWSEILVVGIVALIVVGPKELPTLLRTIGKYMGVIKRQASEFRAQFDEAMRESEFEQLKKDVESIKTDAENTLRDTERAVQSEMSDVRRELDATTDSIKLDHTPSYPSTDAHASLTTDADRHDANGLPMPHETAHETVPADAAAHPAPAGSAAIAAAAAAAASHDTVAREPAKTGA